MTATPASRPGNYIMLGAAKEGDNPLVHHPAYDFNDAVLTTGASYWVTLTEHLLPRRGAQPFRPPE